MNKELCDRDGHVGKVVKWGYVLKDGQMHSNAELYGCIRCDETSANHWPDAGIIPDKVPCKSDCECFGCKVKTLQMNAGDAARDIPDKKWTAKLDNYKKARADGIQPGGTSERHVEAAYQASENLGKAYNAETMPKAHKINKRIAEVVNTGILNAK